MTGSDWRAYELDYINKDYSRSLAKGDFGYAYISTFANSFIKDFWLYSGILKVLFLFSVVYMVGGFVKKTYYVVGLSFAGPLLFMIIDCPMRFMMSMFFVNLAIGYYVKKDQQKSSRRVVVSLLFLFLSILFHAIALLVVLLLLTFPLSTVVKKSNRIVLFFIYLTVFIIVGSSSFFENVFSDVVPLFFEDRFTEYNEYTSLGYMTIGTLIKMFLLILVLYNRELIISKKYGALVYYFAFLSLFLQPVLSCIPTIFRINILNGFFLDIALAHIIIEKGSKIKVFLSRVAIFLLVVLSLIKECRENELLTPYSNSIPYIITGNHLPYSYRDAYNYKHHDEEYLF